MPPGTPAAPPAGSLPPHTVLPPPGRTRKPPKAWLVVVVTLAAVALAGGGIAALAIGTAPYSISGSEVGQCLKATNESGTAYHKKDCADPEAQWRVLAVEDSGETCIDVPG